MNFVYVFLWHFIHTYLRTCIVYLMYFLWRIVVSFNGIRSPFFAKKQNNVKLTHHKYNVHVPYLPDVWQLFISKLVQIRATDNGSPNMSAVAKVIVEVLKIPENSTHVPEIQNPNQKVVLTESDTVGYIVAFINAVDRDHDYLWYRIESKSTLLNGIPCGWKFYFSSSYWSKFSYSLMYLIFDNLKKTFIRNWNECFKRYSNVINNKVIN